MRSSNGACSSLLPYLMLLQTKLLEPVLQVKTSLWLKLVVSEIFLQQFLWCPVMHYMGRYQIQLVQVIKCMIRHQ